MTYSSYKDTSNPFIPKVEDKWDDLLTFDGDSIVENIVKFISGVIVFVFLIALVPIGAVISIYNSFYNFQKKAYDKLMKDQDSSSSQFASSVEFGILILMSLPFFAVLIPYWIIAALVTWFAKHKIMAIIFIAILIACYVFRGQILALFYELF